MGCLRRRIRSQRPDLGVGRIRTITGAQLSGPARAQVGVPVGCLGAAAEHLPGHGKSTPGPRAGADGP